MLCRQAIKRFLPGMEEEVKIMMGVYANLRVAKAVISSTGSVGRETDKNSLPWDIGQV